MQLIKLYHGNDNSVMALYEDSEGYYVTETGAEWDKKIIATRRAISVKEAIAYTDDIASHCPLCYKAVDTNTNGLTLEQFHQKALEAESKYGDLDLINLGDMQDLFDEWENNADPELLVDTMALNEGFTFDPDYDGKVLRYWLVLGRFEYQENQSFVCMAYDMKEAIYQFYKVMRENSDQHIYIDLVTSCGREHPEFSQNEEC